MKNPEDTVTSEPLVDLFFAPPGPPAGRIFKPGKRPSAQERRTRIKMIAQLVGQGMPEHEAVSQLCEKWDVRNPATKKRYLDAYYAYARKGRTISREAATDTAVLQRMELIRRAYLRKRVGYIEKLDSAGNVVVGADGSPVLIRTLVSDPDFDAIRGALDSIARIQGLMQPESVEALDAALGRTIPLWIDVLRRYIVDPIGVGKAARELRIAMAQGSKMLAASMTVEGQAVGAKQA